MSYLSSRFEAFLSSVFVMYPSGVGLLGCYDTEGLGKVRG